MSELSSLVTRLQNIHQIGSGVRFIQHLWRDFWGYGCQKSAAALTYMTLFAIVPLMTVFYFMFSLVPSFSDAGHQLQQMIFTHFVPESGHNVQAYLDDFSEQARSLTGFGVGMLVVTAFLMLTNIEKTFNTIWGVHRSRRGLSSFLLYWAVLSLGPIFVGVAFAMNTYMLSLKLFVDEFDALGVSVVFFKAFPLLMMMAAFTLLFVAVPNCRVPVRFAAIGGMVTAIAFEVVKDIFATVVANSSFQLVYGAFAVVPLFLLWVNLTWTIILTGAIFVRTLAEGQYSRSDGKITDMVATLKCLELFQQRQRQGRTVSDGACYRIGLGVVHWQELRERLEKNGWIVSTSGGRYALLRDLDDVSLWELAGALEVRIHDLARTVANPPDASWFRNYQSVRQRFAEQAKEILGVSVANVLVSESLKDR